MKHILLFIFVLFSIAAIGQDLNVEKEFTYCGKKVIIPKDCVAELNVGLVCDQFEVQWMYLEPDMLSFLPEQYLGQLDDELKKFKKRNIHLLSLGNEIEGYMVSYKEDKELKYKLIAYGTVNDKAVLLNISLPEEPMSNADLPDYIKQFVSFRK